MSRCLGVKVGVVNMKMIFLPHSPVSWYQGQARRGHRQKWRERLYKGVPVALVRSQVTSAPVSGEEDILLLWKHSGNSAFDTNVLFSWWVRLHGFINRRHPRKPEQKGRTLVHLLLCTRQTDKLICLKTSPGDSQMFLEGGVKRTVEVL